ncbi:ABC transporter permease [Oceanobacillus caeni]|uniref:ABC transporter permease n=1 Tax=Oceanobacillus caeni TaxID=405946 RepID=UPI001C21502A|nr:ABC transporter permease [Oceanobacillus caeni]MBU8790387.1 ABC transporter permease [Oceanobacillus caeni]MCR1834612.1 ABC transporter permease [Oceanobacillus caeni]
MNKFWVILSHTYLSKLKAKPFIISTIISLLFVVALANIQSIIDLFTDDEVDQIAVIDESNTLFVPLTTNVEAASNDLELVEFDGTVEEGKDAVINEEYNALLVITLNDKQLPEASYYANNISDTGDQILLEQQVQQLKVALATQYSGIDEKALMEINEPVTFQATALDETAKTEEELNQARGIVYVMLFVLYITVMSYGQLIMTDVANEKSSRVMELLVSSAPAVTHMFAKILGIALLGLTQVGSIIILGIILIKSKQDEYMGGIFEYLGFQDISPAVYVYAIIFFLLGYLVYATIAAMLGSLVSRVEDTGQMMLPLIFLIMIAFFIAMFGLEAPDSTIVKVTSFIPFFSPMIMFMRVGMLDIPTWEVMVSIGIIVLSILLFAYIGAKVYKGGVLLYGRSSSLKDFKKALALSKKDS